MIQRLSNFVCVIVDGDTEKEVCSKNGVQGYPDVRFMTLDGKTHAQVGGFVPVDQFLAQVDAALKSIGPIRPTKAYAKILKARAKLDKAVAKEKWKDALKAIDELEACKHEGPDLTAARRVKAELGEKASALLEEARSLLESDPKKAQALLKELAKDWKGLPAAEEAEKLAAGG